MQQHSSPAAVVDPTSLVNGCQSGSSGMACQVDKGDTFRQSPSKITAKQLLTSNIKHMNEMSEIPAVADALQIAEEPLRPGEETVICGTIEVDYSCSSREPVVYRMQKEGSYLQSYSDSSEQMPAQNIHSKSM